MKRRDFLGRLGWILAALGFSEAGWLRISDRYHQALALPTPRKLALLVGINQYASDLSLNGCVTDVELQRELLIHRFGFQAADILSLTEQKATREQIETTFSGHLIQQAQPGDVVVFHFSGYGRSVQLSQESEKFSPLTLNSLVPVDDVLPVQEAPVVNDVVEDTLLLLLRSLSTDRITTILDTSFHPSSTAIQGNLRSRSYPQLVKGQISTAELAFQQQLQQNLKRGIINDLFNSAAIIPGIILRAASSTQSAIEAKWAGFSAGLFTYALTQYLWEATEPATVQVSLSRVSEVVEQLVGNEQKPTLSGESSQEHSLLNYYLKAAPNLGADGVVTAIEEDKKIVQIWLAGLPLNVLEHYTAGSQLALSPQLNSEASNRSSLSVTAPQLQVRSRHGLTAKAQPLSHESIGALQVGQLVQEVVRVLPRNINLTIALDTSLTRIERVDATSAFATIAGVSLVTAGEQPADYIFGRISEANLPEASTNLLSTAPTSRYGLFSLSQKLIPNTAGEAGEAVKVAVHRLMPKLQTLLAAKLWRLTTNEGSSRLNVKASLEIVNAKQPVLMQRETLRSLHTNSVPARSNTLSPRTASTGIPTVAVGSRIRYRVNNDGDRPLYLLLLGLDSNKNAITLYSTASAIDASNSNSKLLLQDVVIAPGESLIVPQTAVDFEWVIHAPSGLTENQLIFSGASFTQTLAALETAIHPFAEQQKISPLLNPLEVAQAMMQDLHNTSTMVAQRPVEGTTTETISSTADTYTLDVNNWASLSFVYQVVSNEV